MPNEDHLNILDEGVEEWNIWRADNPEIDPDLADASLSFIDLSQADFSRTNLSGANLEGTNLSNAILRFANLTYANLFDADLSSADLEGANLGKARLGQTRFGNQDLSRIVGLKTVVHYGPSIIGIDAIYKSKGKLPEIFLRRAGVPENFITYMASLTRKAFDYYSCFISFTESDDTFAERLYNDLQASGVRCWRWKEDAKWGKTLMRSIDEAVRIYDKLVVICSETSLQSPAVIREIERALQKEDELARQGKECEVLFPIRLDDFIFGQWSHHRKADVVAKNVGDFRNWKEPNLYRASIKRLINDLQTGAIIPVRV